MAPHCSCTFIYLIIWVLVEAREAFVASSGSFVYSPRGLSSCGVCAQLFLGMWDLGFPSQGWEPESPALQGRVLTTHHQGHPSSFLIFDVSKFCSVIIDPLYFAFEGS